MAQTADRPSLGVARTVLVIAVLALLYAAWGLVHWFEGPPRPAWAGLAVLVGGFIGVTGLYLGWTWSRTIREHSCPRCGKTVDRPGALCAECAAKGGAA